MRMIGLFCFGSYFLLKADERENLFLALRGTPVSMNTRPTPMAGNIFKTAAIILDYEYHCSGMSEITVLYSKI